MKLNIKMDIEPKEIICGNLDSIVEKIEDAARSAFKSNFIYNSEENSFVNFKGKNIEVEWE